MTAALKTLETKLCNICIWFSENMYIIHFPLITRIGESNERDAVVGKISPSGYRLAGHEYLYLTSLIRCM